MGCFGEGVVRVGGDCMRDCGGGGEYGGYCTRILLIVCEWGFSVWCFFGPFEWRFRRVDSKSRE